MQESCMAQNLTAVYYSSVRPCGEALANTAEEVIQAIKLEDPKAATNIMAAFGKKYGSSCSLSIVYLECCYRLGNCQLLQNDWHFWIAKERKILDDLKDVQVTDLLAILNTRNFI